MHDLEPLARMVRGDAGVDRLSHTMVGAFGIGIVSAALGKPISEFVLRLFGAREASIGWTVALASAFIGTYSHIVLDAVMHGDMAPFWPLSDANPLLRAMRVRDLYLLCLLSGVAAAAILAFGARRARIGAASR